MRFIAIAIVAASLAGGTAAQAQTVEVGPGGVGLDLRSPRQRERDFEREQDRREEYRERRRAERDYDRRRGGCREVTIRERNDYGEMVTRTRRECRD
jgi:hypothetical protein